MADTIIVNEIILSIQGEGSRAGLPCILVRLTGCNLNCAWCDTPHARTEGAEMSVDGVLARVGELDCRRVEVTGGEPLCQPATLELLRRLCDGGYETLLETNGSLDISPVDPRVARIVDFKCPASGESDSIRWTNVELLRGADEAKFVVADRRDYEFARDAVRAHGLRDKCPVILSPAAGTAAPAELAQWILADGFDVRLGIQLHKIIWPHTDLGV